MMAGAAEVKAEGFGASHTSFYTSAKAKDKYATLDEILNDKVKDTGVREVIKDMLNACVKITEALRVNLVTVADAQNSVFGDVQLGVDVIADQLMWDACKTSKVVQTGASEEEPVLVETNKDGRFIVCWDPLDGSSIVDNNWAVGTMIGAFSAVLVIVLIHPRFQGILKLSCIWIRHLGQEDRHARRHWP
jgi:sedoheptulose-bisphosphatase